MLVGNSSGSAAQHAKDAVQIWRDCASLRIVIQSARQSVHHASYVPQPEGTSSCAFTKVLIDILNLSVKRLTGREVPHGTLSSESIWTALDSQNKVIMNYCLSEADKWHESTKVPNRKNLKALDQSISSQMQYVMTDPDQRAVKRCRGSNADEYDDAPLYAALLKESVQKGASGDEYRAMKVASKFGKRPQAIQIDRRASKGRKIRYSSIEKLVNFMAPRPVPLSEGIPITDEQLINAYVNSIFQ